MVVQKPYYTIGGSLLNVSFTLMVSCLVAWFPCVELSDCFPVLNSVTVSLCWTQWLFPCVELSDCTLIHLYSLYLLSDAPLQLNFHDLLGNVHLISCVWFKHCIPGHQVTHTLQLRLCSDTPPDARYNLWTYMISLTAYTWLICVCCELGIPGHQVTHTLWLRSHSDTNPLSDVLHRLTLYT